MRIIKTIDWYVLRNFLKTFAITFFISLFVLVMQFMFHYADDFIGKGAGLIPIIKLFFYSSLSLIPLSLPLSILLGSLMTFGNFGERLELLSMKAAGISLFRIMMPLILFISALSVGSYIFANRVLPVAQVKMWTLVFSIREKNPELNIPDGSFYSDINGINMYVREKKDGFLQDVVIYDLTNGFDNTGIILADKGKMEMSQDKTYLLLTLYDGESFENMTEGTDDGQAHSTTDIIPYRRESFSKKEIVIDFDGNFAEVSSAFLEGQYVSKNADELQYAIDSIQHRSDSIMNDFVQKQEQTYFNYRTITAVEATVDTSDSTYADATFSNIYAALDSAQKYRVIENAEARCNTVIGDINYEKSIYDWLSQECRIHSIEWHKKFTLAFACFIFLFIGAPLGAIIRKGGMGLPIVISSILFIIYYIIDNTGYKMAREGIWEVWRGMWLSPGVLLPIGVLLTYLAATDNSLINGAVTAKDIKDVFKKIKNFIKPDRNVQTEHN